ncbi:MULTISPECIES: inovirus Gp2 family protein [Enterobacteriaceae]|uniref:Inovirus Gp2 family protein n=1 Tax=Citrobacter bitternis TaxID=1585982 RepID=A0ABW1Q3B9_9ENTR|nr:MULTISPECIES: inovirus Gp2 family protein [Enterobacteriaceae]MBM3073962.1 inovirus Gp2 family protein [Lelliottia sp. RWM.1]MDU4354871.1 inovirus Gp2 family protein [Phytobacter diazotrophicus]MDU7133845.1 inovirus Gp2 family protein [Enterobacteriaceae bacterium]
MPSNSLNADYQQAFYDVICNAVDEFPRTLALRVDLRFPGDYQYGDSNRAITRFIDSLKAKLLVDCRRKNRRWRRNWTNRLRYVWVREVGERNRRKHYHVLLLLNKDFYHGAGSYNADDSLYALIQQAWCSALGLRSAQYSSLANMAENGCFYLNENAPNYMQRINELLKRMEYLSKNHTKCYDDGYRSIGMSRR